MAHWQRQSRSILGLAALLSLLLVQTAFSLPFRQTRINLSPRMLYHNFGSIFGAVLTGSRHIARFGIVISTPPTGYGTSAVREVSPRFSELHTILVNARNALRTPGHSYAECD